MSPLTPKITVACLLTSHCPVEGRNTEMSVVPLPLKSAGGFCLGHDAAHGDRPGHPEAAGTSVDHAVVAEGPGGPTDGHRERLSVCVKHAART